MAETPQGEPSPPSDEQSAGLVTHRLKKKRTGTTRERTGCLTCRKRRKKCPNTYPICQSCQRLNLQCLREEPRAVGPPNGTTPVDSLDAQSIDVPYRARATSQEVARIPDSLQFKRFTDGKGGQGQNDKRHLLKYYVEVLTSLVSTNHENNSFLSVFLPMSYESPPLLSSLIAWSSAHLSCFDPSYKITALEKQTEAWRSVAGALNPSVRDSSTQETNLAACLVLVSTEIALGDTTRWYDHMVGAKSIIVPAKATKSGGEVVSGPDAFMDSSDGKWLLRNFAYHDVLGSVTTGKEPLLKGAYWLSDDKSVVDAYVGVGSEILVLISEISCLYPPGSAPDSPQTGSRVFEETTEMDIDTMTEADQLWQTFTDLETRLRAWTCPRSVQPSLVALAESYRSAALIHLYRRLRQIISSRFKEDQGVLRNLSSYIPSKVTTEIKQTLHQVDLIPLESLPECGLLFPIFMAGGETTDPHQIEAIRARLKLLLDHRGFGNIKRASEVLEELWRLRSLGIKGADGTTDVDWMDVLKRTGTKLMLT